jgi:glycerol-3-phosphate dehydrogenase
LRRDFGRLSGRFDLLVVGGGVYGAWIAYDAALRGLSVALVERRDWASGTSSASSKLIHGGLRYLEYGQLGLVRKALHERSRLLRLAPHRVRPLRFLMPMWRDSRAGRGTVAIGLALYDLLAGDLAGAKPHRGFARDGLLDACPFLAAEGLRGGFAYADAGEDDARFVLELVAGAAAAGAVVVNHAEARLAAGADGAIAGAVVRDVRGGGMVESLAAVTVLAAGPWAPGLVADAPLPVRLTKGVHLVAPPLPAPLGAQDALLLTTRADRRVFFLIPWYGATLIGTTDTDWNGDPDSATPTRADAHYLLREVAARCPGLGWRARDIRGAFAGLRTLQAQAGRSASAVTREWSLEQPRQRLLAPVGGKFTSARVEAAHTVDRVLALLGRSAPCSTAERRFPWAPDAPFGEWLESAVAAGTRLGLDRETAESCARRHGTSLDAVLDAIARDRALAARIAPEAPFCLAEAVHAASHEMAFDLDDVLRRRVPAAILARMTVAQVLKVAKAIAASVGWSPERVESEALAWQARQVEGMKAIGLG